MFDGAPSWSLGASETGESQNAREAVGLIASRWRALVALETATPDWSK